MVNSEFLMVMGGCDGNLDDWFVFGGGEYEDH